MNHEAAIFEKLAQVASIRRRFAPLFRQVVEAQTVHIPPTGSVVEVGSGDGYLAAFLPPTIAQRAVFTEPTSLGLQRLIETQPNAEVRQARADQLPFDDGSVAAVVACCVFDLVVDLDRAWAEWTRVLAPGGVVVHWLDLATDLHCLFAEIVNESNLCALPNVFTDPGATPWPEDLFLIPQAHLEAVIEQLEAGSNAYAVPLSRYRSAFARSPEAAVQVFSGIHESTDARRALRHAFQSAISQSDGAKREKFASFEGRPLSSALVFHKRLLASVPPGYEVLAADIERRTSSHAIEPDAIASAWRSIVGFIQSGTPSDRTERIELGAHIFVARKQSGSSSSSPSKRTGAPTTKF